MSETFDTERRVALERADAARNALENAALALETKQTNSLYRAAFRAAAKIIRALKP